MLPDWLSRLCNSESMDDTDISGLSRDRYADFNWYGPREAFLSQQYHHVYDPLKEMGTQEVFDIYWLKFSRATRYSHRTGWSEYQSNAVLIRDSYEDDLIDYYIKLRWCHIITLIADIKDSTFTATGLNKKYYLAFFPKSIVRKVKRINKGS